MSLIGDGPGDVDPFASGGRSWKLVDLYDKIGKRFWRNENWIHRPRDVVILAAMFVDFTRGVGYDKQVIRSEQPGRQSNVPRLVSFLAWINQPRTREIAQNAVVGITELRI